jgi:hypothetical protein
MNTGSRTSSACTTDNSKLVNKARTPEERNHLIAESKGIGQEVHQILEVRREANAAAVAHREAEAAAGSN